MKSEQYREVSEDEKKEAQGCLSRHEKRVADRSQFESLWQECYDYIIPRKGDVISTRSPGDKRGHELFDSTAINSNELLASALHGMLTNPSTRFFDLVIADPEIDPDEEVKEWLQIVADKMFLVLNTSNFQTEIHEIYLDMGAIGTACLYMGEHDKSVVHFGARPMKEIYIEENNLGLIDTVEREFKWKPRQVVQEFGAKFLPAWVMKKYHEGCDDDWTILHVVEPTSAEDLKKKRSNFEFTSKYILKDEPMIISKKGFKEFPYAVPRWTKTSGEKYGRGPGMSALPDIKMINKMQQTTIDGAQLTIRPPMMVTDDGVIGRVRLTPAGLTVVRQMNEAPIRPLTTDARIDFGFQAIQEVRKQIRAAFYVDQLQLNEGPQMTAAEVFQRTEEKLRLMGPVLGRQHFEFLRPVINRVYRIMERKNLIPDAPEMIQKIGFDVRYSSLIARAQRMSEGQNLTRAIQVAAPIINADPGSMDNINTDATLKYVLDVYGVPQRLLRKNNEVKEMRNARAEAQARAAKEAQEAHEADVAGKVLPGAAAMAQVQKQ